VVALAAQFAGPDMAEEVEALAAPAAETVAMEQTQSMAPEVLAAAQEVRQTIRAAALFSEYSLRLLVRTAQLVQQVLGLICRHGAAKRLVLVAAAGAARTMQVIPALLRTTVMAAQQTVPAVETVLRQEPAVREEKA
jgi:hypothetical protein